MANQEGNTVFDESLRESLSALLDGEATELEARRVLNNVENDADVRAVWSRYQIASRAMAGERQAFSGIDLSSTIAAAIADEPAHNATPEAPAALGAKRGVVSSLFAQAGKVAIAASVAAVAVFAVNQYTVQNDAPASATSFAATDAASADDYNAAANLPMGYGTPGLAVRNVSTDSTSLEQRRHNAVPVQFVPRTESPAASPAVEEFLRQLMAEHANVGSESLGVVPFERVPRIATEAE
ncbi:sigma-E factor negative regulatory protein [Halioxenophilus aromaticivorans]|uniref:Anti sigma-E protein RseA N-terminal domain-containing protein n=1 Tax=Halioxenophilus aromaticivorans TaxID=1306992 RepID=A0AAV3TX10_9ALTE